MMMWGPMWGDIDATDISLPTTLPLKLKQMFVTQEPTLLRQRSHDVINMY